MSELINKLWQEAFTLNGVPHLKYSQVEDIIRQHEQTEAAVEQQHADIDWSKLKPDQVIPIRTERAPHAKPVETDHEGRPITYWGGLAAKPEPSAERAPQGVDAKAINTALYKALTPRQWTQEMSDAWHRNIPDTHKAFEALRDIAMAALATTPHKQVSGDAIGRGIDAVDAWIKSNHREGGFTFSRDFMQHWSAFSGDIVKAVLSAALQSGEQPQGEVDAKAVIDEAIEKSRNEYGCIVLNELADIINAAGYQIVKVKS